MSLLDIVREFFSVFLCNKKSNTEEDAMYDEEKPKETVQNDNNTNKQENEESDKPKTGMEVVLR